MITIYKYTCDLRQRTYAFEFDISKDAVFLDVQAQYLHGNTFPVIWFLVDTEMPTVSRSFVVVLTGGPVPRSALYLGTVQGVIDRIPSSVGHVFEVFRE